MYHYIYLISANCKNVVGEKSINRKRYDSMEFWAQAKLGLLPFQKWIFEIHFFIKYFQKMILGILYFNNMQFIWEHNFPENRSVPWFILFTPQRVFNQVYNVLSILYSTIELKYITKPPLRGSNAMWPILKFIKLHGNCIINDCSKYIYIYIYI